MHAEVSPATQEPMDEQILMGEVLDEYHVAIAHIESLGQRPLGSGLKVLMWSLRVYVLFMAVVVVLNVVQTLH